MNEIWRPIPNTGGRYEASSEGRIRSYAAMGKSDGRTITEPRDRKLKTDRNGYQSVMLSDAGIHKRYRVHRLVWEAFNGPIQLGVNVDHINRDRADNRLDNLRLAPNQGLNIANGTKRKNASSRFFGVEWHKSANKWRAKVRLDGKVQYCALFDDETEAARARDGKARELQGEFAHLNFPEAS